MRHAGFILSLLLLSAPPAGAQLANTGFETPGTGGQVFNGWSNFGIVSSSATLATEGSTSARLRAPQGGGFDLSGVYQDIPIAPGGYVRVTVRSGFTSIEPVVGDTRGIVNVEWRDGAGGLISYRSLASSMSADPADTTHGFEHIVGPAPAGAATARLLLGAFSTPNAHPGTVYYDEADMVAIAPPTIDDIQWNDVGERVINWSGYDWRVKRGGLFGPGGNFFTDAPDAVWVDAQGRLHMKIIERDGQWYSSEIILDELLGFGEYTFRAVGRVDQLDINTVLGIFTWEYQLDYTGIETQNIAKEFDIEFSRWKNPANDPAQFICQPWQAGNISRYDFTPADSDAVTTHVFDWMQSRIDFRAWYGSDPIPDPADIINDWTFVGADNPPPEMPRLHINFWMIEEPPSDGQEHEIILESFEFLPGCGEDVNGDGSVDIDDLHHIHQNPSDINSDGVADSKDARCLEHYLRRRELLDMRDE